VPRALASLNVAYLVAITSYVVAGLFLELAYERYFWLVLALACSAVRLAGIAAAEAPSPTGRPPSGARR
jgi:hypothetical protein